MTGIDLKKEVTEFVQRKEPPHIMLIYGYAGQGKTTSVLMALNDLEVRFTRINGMTTTAYALYDVLYEYKEDVVLIDDMNEWDRKTIALLLQAGDDTEPRKITWRSLTAKRDREVLEFEYKGKIIITCNELPTGGAHALALISRAVTIKWECQDEILAHFPQEIQGLVKALGLATWRDLRLFKEDPKAFFLKMEVMAQMPVQKAAVAYLIHKIKGEKPWELAGMGKTMFYTYLQKAKHLGLIDPSDPLVEYIIRVYKNAHKK